MWCSGSATGTEWSWSPPTMAVRTTPPGTTICAPTRVPQSWSVASRAQWSPTSYTGRSESATSSGASTSTRGSVATVAGRTAGSQCSRSIPLRARSKLTGDHHG